MFYIIGIGLNTKQITIEAMDAIKNCSEVYIDNYTNIFSNGDVDELEKTISKKIIKLNRTELEQEMKFLKDNSCLLVIGNPFSATTHYTILEEAKQKNLKVKTISGISIFNYRGNSGLFEYKFGKTTSIVYPMKNYKPTSFYDCIIDNLKIGAHTLCLLDIKVEEKRFMNVLEACQLLEEIDINKNLENLTCVALCGISGIDEKIITFDFKDYNKLKFNSYPQSLIICGNLNEFEKRAIDEYRC
jgi:diphthine synthase